MSDFYKPYILQIAIGEHPRGSFISYIDGQWLVGNKTYDTRGNIAEGEMAMLFSYIVDNELYSILKPWGKL